MQIILKNQLRRFFSKKINYLWIFALLFMIYNFAKSLTNNSDLIKAVGYSLTSNNYILVVLISLFLFSIINLIFDTKSISNRNQMYLIGYKPIKFHIVISLFLYLIFIILSAYYMYLFTQILSIKDIVSIYLISFIMSLLTYAMKQNIVTLILGFISMLLFIKFSIFWITIIFYIISICLYVYSVFSNKNDYDIFKFDVSNFSKSKFVESIIYISRSQKVIRWIVLNLILFIYNVFIPKQYHYLIAATKYDPAPIILTITLIVWMVKGLIIKRESNFYTRKTNHYVHAHYLLFTVIIFTILQIIDFGFNVNTTGYDFQIYSVCAFYIIINITLIISITIRKKSWYVNLLTIILLIVIPSKILDAIKPNTIIAIIHILITLSLVCVEYSILNRLKLKTNYKIFE